MRSASLKVRIAVRAGPCGSSRSVPVRRSSTPPIHPLCEARAEMALTVPRKVGEHAELFASIPGQGARAAAGGIVCAGRQEARITSFKTLSSPSIK